MVTELFIIFGGKYNLKGFQVLFLYLIFLLETWKFPICSKILGFGYFFINLTNLPAISLSLSEGFPSTLSMHLNLTPLEESDFIFLKIEGVNLPSQIESSNSRSFINSFLLISFLMNLFILGSISFGNSKRYRILFLSLKIILHNFLI